MQKTEENTVLQLKNIKKHYDVGDTCVQALDGVSIDFRESEFVSILGPSGCGKTTLLNIVGGLDRYSDGDLCINGRSTKKFRDSDWDTYRNHSVGFVFQSYNLIPHQSVLRNVELALTLSGVSRAERRRRAVEALQKVGLGDQLGKKPNQMSGGQMQRVAIARAIVNDPDILLADEPTGALDTQTSVQIMEILKEIAEDKLVIMVTHNPELAETYSTRIVKLRDGHVIDDSMPFTAPEEEEEIVRKTTVRKGKRASMSFVTALSLSLNNLMTKKGRTFMTSFAGSIGIIGIALILSLSNGINNYIALVQEDALSTYPLSIMEQSQDYTAMMGAMTEVGKVEDHRDSGMIYVDDSMGTMMSAMSATVNNNLEKFKAYLDETVDEEGTTRYEAELKPYLSSIQYTYNFDLQIFSDDGKTQVNPTTIFDNMGDAFSGVTDMMSASGMKISALSEMIDNPELLNQQYELVEGEWPDADNELVLVISKNNQISKMALYMLGVLDQGEIEEIIAAMMQGNPLETEPIEPFEYEYFIGKTFYLINTPDFYEMTDRTYTVDGETYPIWRDIREELNLDDDRKAEYVIQNGKQLKITGIIRPAKGATATSIATNLAYTHHLTDYILAKNADSDASKIIDQQKNKTPNHNVLTGLQFERTVYTPENIGDLIDTIPDSTMNTLYAYMTTEIKKQFEKVPPVNAETFAGFVSVMNASEQAQLLDVMSAEVKKLPSGDMIMAGICDQLSTETLPVTPANVKELLPILNKPVKLPEGMAPAEGGVMDAIQLTQSMYLFMSLQQVCGESAMTDIYEYMNSQLSVMTVHEDNFKQLIGLIAYDEETFNTLADTLYEMAPKTDATLDSTLLELGDSEKGKPASINFYAKDFESKDAIEAFLENYNDGVEEVDQLKYTDMIGILLSSVTTIINAISYVLIAFVSISLVVSSIMIGIITYISVLERTKEIGILRAMGASKRDISRVFNAETLIIGLCAGMIGIAFTILICIPVSAIIQGLSGIPSLAAVLPWQGGIALVLISMLLTIVAGLIPSRVAAKKDPVVALRTE